MKLNSVYHPSNNFNKSLWREAERFKKDTHSMMSLRDIYFKMKQEWQLGRLVDDGVSIVTIKTPPGWKCPRPNCKTDWLHKHSSYQSLA